MKSIGPVKLFATSSESSYALPANTLAIVLLNYSGAAIRYAFATGKVAVATSASAIVFPEYETLAAYAVRELKVNISSGTIYFASTLSNAEFTINPIVA